MICYVESLLYQCLYWSEVSSSLHLFLWQAIRHCKMQSIPRCRGIPWPSSASSASITPSGSPILSRWTLVIVLLYISCDCNHIPTGVGLGWGCAPQMAKEYFPFRWTQLTELLKEFTADRKLSRCVSFMLILLCFSLLLCICTSLSLHPTLCLSSSLSSSQPFSLCPLFPPLLSLNKLVRHSTLIVFFLSFYPLILLLFFFLPDTIYVCPPFFTHMCTHTHRCTHPLLSFCPSYLDLHQSGSSIPLPLSLVGALLSCWVTPKAHPL